MATNHPPTNGIRVPADVMRSFLDALFQKAGMQPDGAPVMGAHLVDSDLHGIFSHGSIMAARYIEKMLDGSVNPSPSIRLVESAGSVRVIDGDGGMGHLCCHRGMDWAIEEAKRSGLAAVATRNHYHCGALGTYARTAVGEDCIGLVVSSRRFRLDPDESVRRANPGSPIAIGFPSGKEPPLVVDFGVTLPWDRKFFDRHPAVYLKFLALGSALQALGAVLPGVYDANGGADQPPWVSDQGAFIIVLKPESFTEIDTFKAEMDRYIGQARAMRPLPGLDQADLAGGSESRYSRQYRRMGIPVEPAHERTLRDIALRLGVESPFDSFERTRFGTSNGSEPTQLLKVGRKLVNGVGRRLTGRRRP